MMSSNLAISMRMDFSICKAFKHMAEWKLSEQKTRKFYFLRNNEIFTLTFVQNHILNKTFLFMYSFCSIFVLFLRVKELLLLLCNRPIWWLKTLIKLFKSITKFNLFTYSYLLCCSMMSSNQIISSFCVKSWGKVPF